MYAHILTNAPTPLCFLVKFSHILRLAWLQPRHQIIQNRGSKTPCASNTTHQFSTQQAIAFMGISHGQGFIIIITQTELILVSQPLQFLKKTLMQMKNSFIML